MFYRFPFFPPKEKDYQTIFFVCTYKYAHNCECKRHRNPDQMASLDLSHSGPRPFARGLSEWGHLASGLNY